ncbi:DUF4381 domain-containing protein [Alkaliphilus peptidifermentans]|uniref:Uncharacterized protein n=1 Tax=Alkaliphilus peptidifermentans DSM 18978 TaxID=1120976 RepID=A0A1G5JTR4_9FIRM|nr:hypothetical protein [Alkaliphilus peptidifermentans]SCY91260.1 hypothetical protein SAMN03080606_03021 [Alkaliphilus peptidifermentans DSM 18978]
MSTDNSSYHAKNKDLHKNPPISWWLSWPIIIIVTIVFWPVGIFLIWKRTTIDKKAALISGKIITIIGWISVAFAVIGLLVSISEGLGSDDVFMILFFLIAGGALIFLGRRTKQNAERFKKYISIIVNHEETSINNIAAAIPTSYEVAKKDIQKMINRGYFSGAYINETLKEIILPKEQDIYNMDTNVKVDSNPNLEMVAVRCKGCGANNKIRKGSVDECQYCGSPINS